MDKNMILLLIASLALTISSINVPLCLSGSVIIGFKDTQSVTDSTTRAYLCHDRKKLYANWENLDEQIISTYTNCNDPLYKEDVV